MNTLAPYTLGQLAGLSGLAPGRNALAPAPAPAPVERSRWLFVRQRFDTLVEAIGIPGDVIERGSASVERITASLNTAYWGHNDRTLNRIVGGSWGKQTRVHPTRDIDMIFVMPAEVYYRFEKRSGNRQSYLLGEVKAVLGETYSTTALRGDGQVVVIPLNHITIEVVPAFRYEDGSLIICDSNDGGRYKPCQPDAEFADLHAADLRTGGTARHLARLAKLWRRTVDAPIDAFVLERLAVEYLAISPWTMGNAYWYDFIVRDFFGYLVGRADGWITMPGTGEWIALGRDWLTKAKAAQAIAIDACFWEDHNFDAFAAAEWRKLFGPSVRSFA